MQIPDDYTVTFLPDTTSYVHRSFTFQIFYELKDKSIIYNFDLDINTIKVEEKDFTKWNEFIKKLNKAYKNSIELTRKL